MPFPFLPLDSLPYAELESLVPRRARNAPYEHDEALRRRRLVAADHAVQAGERDLDIASRDTGMREAVRPEVLDLA
jgi:hypothetical protein